MPFEFDHLFICTDIGAKAADQLISAGLTEGSSNTHTGQGTANRRFFFHNAGLELLWAHSQAEAQSERIRRTYLWERWHQRQTNCPFGICLRPTKGSQSQIAFPYWDFRPPYLPEPLSIAVGTNSHMLSEPMVFQTPFGKRPDTFSSEKAQPLLHPLGLREITRVELTTPHRQTPSPALQATLETEQIILKPGPTHRVKLGFDGETQGQTKQFHPDLPLTLSW